MYVFCFYFRVLHSFTNFHHHLGNLKFTFTLQMMGSTGENTPPPPPVVQYATSSMTPHPPVYGKPYLGASMSPLVASQTDCSSSPSLSRELLPKRHMTASSFPAHSSGGKNPSSTIIGHPYAFLQSKFYLHFVNSWNKIFETCMHALECFILDFYRFILCYTTRRWNVHQLVYVVWTTLAIVDSWWNIQPSNG